jgi:hypothetical protein
MKFSKESNDPIPLIRGLIAMAFDKYTKEYPEIMTFSSRSKGDSKSRSKSDTKGKSNKKESPRGKDGKLKKEKKESGFSVLEVNLGEADKIKPNLLVNTLHDELKIHREHFGKIKTDKTRTYFEVNSDALRFFNTDKKVKLANKTLTFRLVDKKLR